MCGGLSVSLPCSLDGARCRGVGTRARVRQSMLRGRGCVSGGDGVMWCRLRSVRSVSEDTPRPTRGARWGADLWTVCARDPAMRQLSYMHATPHVERMSMRVHDICASRSERSGSLSERSRSLSRVLLFVCFHGRAQTEVVFTAKKSSSGLGPSSRIHTCGCPSAVGIRARARGTTCACSGIADCARIRPYASHSHGDA